MELWQMELQEMLDKTYWIFLKIVQYHIEVCLLRYMTKTESKNTITWQRNINPRVFEIVWQSLEADNQEFFKAYYIMLLVKRQILEFNWLLLEQVRMMDLSGMIRSAPVPTFDGSQVSSTQSMSMWDAAQNIKSLYIPVMQQLNVRRNNGSLITSHFQGITAGPSAAGQNTGSLDGFRNSGSSVLPHAEERFDMSGRNANFQNSNAVLAQNMIENIVKTEADNTGSLSFNSVESNAHNIRTHSDASLDTSETE